MLTAERRKCQLRSRKNGKEKVDKGKRKGLEKKKCLKHQSEERTV